MWNKIISQLDQFPDPILTGIDGNGYPYSTPCKPLSDEARQVILIPLKGDVPIQPGPAGLLYHSHNEALWNLKEIQILGNIEPTGQGWIFTPNRFLYGNGKEGFIGQFKMITKARADANHYLQKRSLSRPKIHWDEIVQVKREAKKSRQG